MDLILASHGILSVTKLDKWDRVQSWVNKEVNREVAKKKIGLAPGRVNGGVNASKHTEVNDKISSVILCFFFK